jgi:hypothetical protein
MPRQIQKRAATPVDTTLSELSPLTTQEVGAMITMLERPIGRINSVIIDFPIDYAVAAAEIDLLRQWASDLLVQS